MSTSPTAYDIVKTAMFPCQWKIFPVGNWKPNNSFSEYFRTIVEAENEIKRRGAVVRRKEGV